MKGAALRRHGAISAADLVGHHMLSVCPQRWAMLLRNKVTA